MPRILSTTGFRHDRAEALGVLLVNLGTPDAPTTAAVRRYLREFLADPRVVELPRWLWWLILHGFVLRVRPSRSAHAYQQIWTDDGSPLLLYSQSLTAAIAAKLSSQLQGNVHVELAMSYGNPSIESALQRLRAANAQRIVLLPLYPQYSSTTTGSVFEAVTKKLARYRWIPELRFVSHYHDDAEYIGKLADTVRSFRAKNGSGEKLLFSFHGIPKDSLIEGDPYHCHCQKTARLVAKALGLGDGDWLIAFQSRVGRQEWLTPYTDETIQRLGAGNTRKLDVVCPGFAVDCLETLEEIAIRNAEVFNESGGGELRYVPALNDSDEHAAFLARLIVDHAAGWPETLPHFNPDSGLQESLARARSMGAGC